MDFAFLLAPGFGMTMTTSPFRAPVGELARKVRANPTANARFRAEVARVGSPPVWNVAELVEITRQLEALVLGAPRSGRVPTDVAAFQQNLGPTRDFLMRRPMYLK